MEVWNDTGSIVRKKDTILKYGKTLHESMEASFFQGTIKITLINIRVCRFFLEILLTFQKCCRKHFLFDFWVA